MGIQTAGALVFYISMKFNAIQLWRDAQLLKNQDENC
jgi:hypothetical protein